MNDLLIWNPKELAAIATDAAIELRKNLLESATAIVSVDNEMDKAVAVQEQKSLKGFLADAERTRELLVRPHLDGQRDVNEKVKEFVSPVVDAHNRIQKLVSDRLAKERQEREAAEHKRRCEAQAIADEAIRIERQRQEAIAKANSEAAKKQAQEDFLLQQKALETRRTVEVVKPPPPKPEGMVERGAWKIVVNDIAKVYAAHPELVHLELNKAEANRAMKDGLRECPGATITFEITAGTRA